MHHLDTEKEHPPTLLARHQFQELSQLRSVEALWNEDLEVIGVKRVVDTPALVTVREV